MDLKSTKERLEKAGQEQLLAFYDELDDAQKESLLAQIEKIDLNDIRLEKEDTSDDVIEPIEAETLAQLEKDKPEFEEIGLEAIRAGKVAAVLLAGGQGTRLGLNGPKGAYNIGLTKELYIFECLINNLLEVTQKAGCSVPLLIMTSDKNDKETREFLKEHDYFGYDETSIEFFIQDMAPTTDLNGKIYLEEKGKVSLSPNGNGGWYKSLKKAGIADKLEAEGIEWINVFAVDNVLQRIADPAFIGATIKSGHECGSKVISKAAPDERVGVMCYRNGRPSIVEYYELTPEMATEKDESGRLAYNWGVILNYLFRLDVMNAVEERALPLHSAKKKIPHIDENGDLIKNDEPDGYKFETLVLDMVEMMEGCLVYEVDRAKEFAPVKNASGTDSPDSARAMLAALGVEL